MPRVILLCVSLSYSPYYVACAEPQTLLRSNQMTRRPVVAGPTVADTHPADDSQLAPCQLCNPPHWTSATCSGPGPSLLHPSVPYFLSQLLGFLSISLEAWHCCPAPPSTAASYRSRDTETVLCYYCTDKPSLASIMAARDPPRLPVLEHPRNWWRGPGVSLSFSYLSLLCHSLFRPCLFYRSVAC